MESGIQPSESGIHVWNPESATCLDSFTWGDLFLDASLNSCVKSVMQKSARLFLIGGCIDS